MDRRALFSKGGVFVIMGVSEAKRLIAFIFFLNNGNIGFKDFYQMQAINPQEYFRYIIMPCDSSR
jgi:hypothetical protein